MFSSAVGMFGVGGWMRGCWGGGEEPEDGRRMGGVPLPTVPLKFIMSFSKDKFYFYTVLFNFLKE